MLHRLTVPSILIACVVAAAVAARAEAADPGSRANRATADGVPAEIVFPVVGRTSYADDFGDPRAQGGHPGNDILAPRRALVLAVEPGKIVFWTTSASAGCMLYLYGRSGTTYQYIHLNNDVGARNDNRGSCVPGTSYAPGLRDGQAVKAGELIAYVGDSGDADGLHPHLHFEIHPGNGAPVSPYRWLQRAMHLGSPSGAGVTEPAIEPLLGKSPP